MTDRAISSKPVYVFANFSAGGVPAGITQGILTRYIEETSDRPISSLIHAFNAQSAGSAIAVPLFAPSNSNAAQPRYTADETLEMFRENARAWLPRPLSYHKQYFSRLRHAFMKASGNPKYLFNAEIVAETLTRYLGDLRFGELLRPGSIMAHDYTSQEPRNSARSLSEATSPNARVVEAMQASMAVPGHYQSKYIEGVGHLSDMGHIHGGNLALTQFRKSLPDDAVVHYIEFGTPRFHGYLPPAKYDLQSAADMILDGSLIGSTSNHSYSMAIQTIVAELGLDHVCDLTPHHDIQKFKSRKDLPISENFLDSSKAATQRLEESAEAYIKENKDRIDTLVDFLVRNERHWQASTAPVTLPATKGNIFSRWLHLQPQAA